MRPQCIALAALLATAVFAQPEVEVDRTLPLVNASTPQACTAINNVIRSVLDIRQATADIPSKSIVLHATGTEIAAAEWLFSRLDRPTGAAPPAGPRMQEYVPSYGNPVRIYYLAHLNTPESIQSVVNAVRSIADIQRFFPISESRVIAMRGKPEQLAMAEWALNQLDRPPTPLGQATPAQEFRGAAADQVARVFYLTHINGAQTMQELVNVTRSITNVQRFFPLSDGRAIAMRGTAAQAALTEWMIRELDRPAGSVSPDRHEYDAPDTRESVVRLFFLRNPGPGAGLMEMASTVRTASGMQRAYPYPALGAIAVRGTAAEVAQAEQTIGQR